MYRNANGRSVTLSPPALPRASVGASAGRAWRLSLSPFVSHKICIDICITSNLTATRMTEYGTGRRNRGVLYVLYASEANVLGTLSLPVSAAAKPWPQVQPMHRHAQRAAAARWHGAHPGPSKRRSASRASSSRSLAWAPAAARRPWQPQPPSRPPPYQCPSPHAHVTCACTCTCTCTCRALQSSTCTTC